MSNPRWAEKYMTVPYVSNGNSFAGVNCWGLVSLVLKTEKGIEVAEYNGISAAEIRKISRSIRNAKGIPPWQTIIPVGSEQPFDVVTMKGLVGGHPLEIHVGIVTAPGICLHIARKLGAVQLPFRDSPAGRMHRMFENKITGIFRHEQLA